MITVFAHRNGETTRVETLDTAWLVPGSGVTVWVDLAEPTSEEAQHVLVDQFHFHPLSVEDALSAVQFPKIESYGAYLYVILHGIDFEASKHQFATRDVDFMVGTNYLVTVHDGQSRSIANLREMCDRHARLLAEGPVALMHRIVDAMVDHYQPIMARLEEEIDALDDDASLAETSLVRRVLELKRDLSRMRRVLVPQRDAVARLARREFAIISDETAYRYRDVYDHVVRLTEEAILFQERITGILDLHLSTVSNRLNQVMKVLTVMSTIFLPLTVLTSMWGMNITLPHFPGGEALQFWWLAGIMAAIIGAMLIAFRRKEWI